MSRTKLRGVVRWVLGAAALLVGTLRAGAADLSLTLQPQLAVPLSATASRGAGLGRAGSIQALLGLGRYLDLELGVGCIGLPMSSAELSSFSGMASTYGAGLRLRRPHDLRSFGGASPWLEAEGLHVDANRVQGAGFAVGAGVAFPLGLTRSLWFGPFLRYLDILLPDRSSLDRRNARALFAGVTVEIVMSR